MHWVYPSLVCGLCFIALVHVCLCPGAVSLTICQVSFTLVCLRVAEVIYSIVLLMRGYAIFFSLF